MGTKTSAHALVAKKFDSMKAASIYWPHVDHSKIRDEIEFRIDSPDMIWQSTTSLCGMATFFNTLAWEDPYLYAFYVVEMYRCGAAWLGYVNQNGQLVTASKTTRNSQKPKTMASADWVALASLRDHLNSTLHYSFDMGIPVLKEIPLLGFLGNPSLVEKVGGMTLPENMVNILKAVGFTKVKSHAYKSTHASGSELDEASGCYKQGCRVLILVNTDIKNDDASWSPLPNHWLRLVDPIAKKGGKVRAKVYNPQTGEHEYLPASGDYLTKDQFLGNFFGYIAAKH